MSYCAEGPIVRLIRNIDILIRMNIIFIELKKEKEVVYAVKARKNLVAR